MNKFLNLVLLGVLCLNVTGCATSVASAGPRVVANKEHGVIYGAAWFAYNDDSIEACNQIRNADARCNNASDYVLVTVFSRVGFADGVVGATALMLKSHPDLNLLKHKMGTGNKNMPYVKVRVIPGQLAEILEVTSKNGDGVCYWSGMPRAGGTVCPGLYDYRKDFTGIDLRFG